MLKNLHDEILHNSFMLFFYRVSTETRYNGNKIFLGEFFLASLLKAYCSTLPFSNPCNFASSASLKMQLQFFSARFLELIWHQSFEKFNDDKRKICCSWGSSQERRMYLAAYWGDLRGEEEANKMVFKIHVVHLHTHRSLKWFVILMDE